MVITTRRTIKYTIDKIPLKGVRIRMGICNHRIIIAVTISISTDMVIFLLWNISFRDQ